MPRKKSDLKHSVEKWKKENPGLSATFDEGYELFKIGALIKQAREEAGLTQAELAEMTGTKRPAISRLENQTQDVKLSTLEKVARALGKHLEVRLAG